MVSQYLFQCYDTQANPAAMNPQIVLLRSAAARSKSAGQVVVPKLRFFAGGLSFQAVVLRNGCRYIPLTC